MYFCYLFSYDKVRNYLFFNILVFINFILFTFVYTNCVVYCGTGTQSYILEKYSFLHKCFKCKRKKHFASSKICKGKRKGQNVNECFHIGRETIHKVHANLRLNGKPIKSMLDSGATVKDNKIEHLLKKGKKLDISVYRGKKLELKEL